MHNYHTLRKACLLAALALGTAFTVSAQQWRNFGVHEFEESKAVSDEKAHEFLAIFGYVPTTEDGKDYDNKTANLKTPVGVAVNEMILVEVNPYWRGPYHYPDTKQGVRYYNEYKGEYPVAPLWNQAKYGIKAIHKVGEPNVTASGKLYSYAGKLGRFFFAKRRKTAYVDGLNGDKWIEFGRWYDEWSLLDPNINPANVGWADFPAFDHYEDFIKGSIWRAPHNCDNSLENNHFVSFIKEGQEDSFDGYNVTMLFYISDKTDGTVGKAGSVAADKPQPFMCMLRAVQDPTKVAKVGEETTEFGIKKYYDVTVTFNSSFTEAEKSMLTKDNETMWNSTKGGVKEYFDIYRTDADGVRTPVATNVPADQLSKDPETGKYTYVDTNGGAHFPGEGALGTDYVYDITSKLYNADAAGVITGEAIATAQSENRSAHIPGGEAFSLAVDGETKCTYQPSTTFGEGRNNFKHIINTEVVNDFVYTAGDVIELRQFIGTSETPSWKKTGEPLTLPESGTAFISAVIEADWRQTSYEFSLKGGESQDAKYQLVLMRKNAETDVYEDIAWSNELTLSAYRADLIAGTLAHRQGHPSDNFGPAKELYHNEVVFTPSKDAYINTYSIACNGTAGDATVVTRADYGSGGQPYTVVALHNDDFANASEGASTAAGKTLFYTNIARDIKGNTYGSADVEFTFEGTPQELVYYGGETKTEVSHNDWAWGGKFDVNLLAGSNTASDVKPELILGVKIYGKFYEKDGNEEVFVEERELCSFIGWNEDLKYSYDKDINLYYDPDFKTEKAALLEVYNNYGTESEQAKAAWEALCEDFWYRFIPRYMYAEITFLNPDINLIIKGAPVARAALSNSTYTKYTNWAELSVPDFKNPIITAIDNIGVDDPAAPAEYYDMHGRRVLGPTPGQLLIRRQGTTVTKVF